LRYFPEGASLTLKSEWRQCAIVSAAPSDAGSEQIGVSEKVGSHERAIAVAADPDAVAVSDAHFNDFVDCGFGARNYLPDISVIGGRARPHDRHGRVVEDRVALRQQEEVRGAAYPSEAIRRARNLAGGICIGKLARVGPHHERQPFPFLVVGWEVERA